MIGALGALLLVAAGVFWWQGRAASDNAPQVPQLAAPAPKPGASADPLPESDAGDAVGADLPEVPEETKEQKRFDRLDRDHDGKITMPEMLGPRAKEFRKLDTDGNNLLTFDEWAAKAINKFKGADKNGSGFLTREEFATTKGKPRKPSCKCKKTE
ncbi:EF-hand domain-containing protein [Novosphingobium sp.]|uniref:EF-hand domain-containing protein n=1 Tax=Novosphingobium sp. TaxID=1874826 RepID=UPI0033407DB8